MTIIFKLRTFVQVMCEVKNKLGKLFVINY